MDQEAQRRGWEHFDGDPATLVQKGDRWFDGEREVVIVSGDLRVDNPRTLKRHMAHFNYLNPADFQEYDVFLVYRNTYK